MRLKRGLLSACTFLLLCQYVSSIWSLTANTLRIWHADALPGAVRTFCTIASLWWACNLKAICDKRLGLRLLLPSHWGLGLCNYRSFLPSCSSPCDVMWIGKVTVTLLFASANNYRNLPISMILHIKFRFIKCANLSDQHRHQPCSLKNHNKGHRKDPIEPPRQ